MWQEMKEIVGKKKTKKTKPWISARTIEMAEKKRGARKNGETELYKQLKKEIKSNIREDKRLWLEDQRLKIKNWTETTSQSYFLKR